MDHPYCHRHSECGSTSQDVSTMTAESKDSLLLQCSPWFKEDDDVLLRVMGSWERVGVSLPLELALQGTLLGDWEPLDANQRKWDLQFCIDSQLMWEGKVPFAISEANKYHMWQFSSCISWWKLMHISCVRELNPGERSQPPRKWVLYIVPSIYCLIGLSVY